MIADAVLGPVEEIFSAGDRRWVNDPAPTDFPLFYTIEAQTTRWQALC